jgi:anthranilate 1,2-dioxygenase large subunit/terephthalate 1,2-dioxygenase oxygenase component alpha subunit
MADTSHIPYRYLHDPALYRAEQERIFQGPTWHYLCLDVEVPEGGSFVTTQIGETPVVVVRDNDGTVRAMVNRCRHKGALVCVEPRGKAPTLRCLYHGWSYYLDGRLRLVPFEKGLEGKGGMPECFNKADHGLLPVRIAIFNGVVFGTLSSEVEPLETYLGPEMCHQLRRVFHKPVQVLGYYHQVLHNNWKLYAENARDSYHATILHAFYATFKLNRLTMGGGLVVNHDGWNTMNYSIGASLQDGEYDAKELRSVMPDIGLEGPQLLDHRLEYPDGITVAIQSIFPACVHQQIYNTLAMRQLVPLGPDRAELHWTVFGYADDDAELRALRLRQGNLIGPAGYVSMEDGVIGEYVQRGIAGSARDEQAVLLMGGSDIGSVTDSRANETTVRGFWQGYRTLMGDALDD